MTGLESAIEAATSAVAASSAYRTHRDDCQHCTLNRACEESRRLQEEAFARTGLSRAALLTYLPIGAMIAYHGPQAHLHGDWWVADTDRAILHSGYILTRPHGQKLEGVAISDVRTVIDPAPTGTLAAVRAAVSELGTILAMCGEDIPLHVDYDESGRVVLHYPQERAEHAMNTARVAKKHAVGEANERASYVMAALDSLHAMRLLAQSGALTPVNLAAESARRLRRRLESAPTRRGHNA